MITGIGIEGLLTLAEKEEREPGFTERALEKSRAVIRENLELEAREIAG